MVRVGPGDDAAALRIGGETLLVTTDALVAGVHWRPGWLLPRALGERAYRVNASDVAAMGGRPLAAVVAMEVPRGTRAAVLDGIVAGFVTAARRHGAVLVGGNVARGPALAITVTLLGRAGPRVVTRAGARPGDDVVLTGVLGAMGAAVRDRRRGRRTALPRVPDRVAAGVHLARVASAMIDVSDGLVQDLGHMARASGVAIRLAADRVPVAPLCRSRLGANATAFALTAGEDYELACTVPRRRRRALDRLARRLGCRLTRIGVVERGRPAVTVVDAAGRPLALGAGGFDHLAGPRRRR
jgi:thiamine-monophosphate kinase